MYYPCSENKGRDQLRGYREADLRLRFCVCKKPVFSRCGSNKQILSVTHLNFSTVLFFSVHTCILNFVKSWNHFAHNYEPHHKKPAFCIYQKTFLDTYQLCKLISPFVFPSQILEFFLFPYQTFQVSAQSMILQRLVYCKSPKFSDTHNVCCNQPKI